MNMIFHERKPMSDFFFRDALEHWMPTYDKMRFYNTRIPMTLVSFNTPADGRTLRNVSVPLSPETSTPKPRLEQW